VSAAPDDLPLRRATSPAWAPAALADPLALLSDHAHLEQRAAANALALLPRCPGPTRADDPDAVERVTHWTRALAAVARDEVLHLRQVLTLLRKRGGSLGRFQPNPYAGALRRRVREGQGVAELVDRLLVSALIEARSCERFERLVEATDPEDDLGRLYRGLGAAERGHYRLFLDLARGVPGGGDVEARWSDLLDVEAEILAAQPPGPRVHGGDPAPPPG
jgi:tRNA-(ms[2]io[6]A)-hydroxylase